MSDTSKRISELEKILAQSPDADEFYEYASLLSEQEKLAEARDVLIKGLAAKQRHGAARLLLARLYYQDGLGEFCVRELIELKKYVQSPALDKLLDAFGEYAHPYLPHSSGKAESHEESDAEEEQRLAAEEDAQDEQEDVLAEIDIDAEFDEIFDEIDD